MAKKVKLDYSLQLQHATPSNDTRLTVEKKIVAASSHRIPS